MADLYVVKRAFRSRERYFAVGTFIEDLQTVVKRGKIKISEGKIVRVPDEGPEREALFTYFETRKGIDLRSRFAERVSKGSTPAEPAAKGTDTTPTGTPTPEAPAASIPSAPKHPMPTAQAKAAKPTTK